MTRFDRKFVKEIDTEYLSSHPDEKAKMLFDYLNTKYTPFEREYYGPEIKWLPILTS